MDKWDEEKLRNVVLSKGGNPRTTTDVCPPWLVLAMYVTDVFVDRLQVLHPGYRGSTVWLVLYELWVSSFATLMNF